MIGEVKKIREEENINSDVKLQKRGRRLKKDKKKYVVNVEKTKFVIDLSKDKKSLEMVCKLLREANEKDYGREITFKELSIYAVEKLNQKDIEKIQENSLDEMEKVERALNDYNSKNSIKLTLGEFLVKKLNII